MNKKDFKKEIIKENIKLFILYSLYILFSLIIFYIIYNNFLENKDKYIYQDDYVIIKEVWKVWYYVYSKDGILKEIKFFNNENNKNNEIIGYINNNLVYKINPEEDKFLLKNKDNILEKTIKEKITDDIQISNFYKINDKNFIILFKNKDNNYCFIKNNFNFDNNPYCIKSNKKDNISFFVKEYLNYYLIIIDNNIYFVEQNSNNNNVKITLNSKDIIKDISINNNWELKINSLSKEYKLSKMILDYYIMKNEAKWIKSFNLNLDSNIY